MAEPTVQDSTFMPSLKSDVGALHGLSNVYSLESTVFYAVMVKANHGQRAEKLALFTPHQLIYLQETIFG